MARTEEQILADNVLEEAIRKNLAAYGFLEGEYMLGDWVVCVELVSFAEDEAGRTRYAHLIPGEGMPYHRLLGLMDVTRAELDREARCE